MLGKIKNTKYLFTPSGYIGTCPGRDIIKSCGF